MPKAETLPDVQEGKLTLSDLGSLPLRDSSGSSHPAHQAPPRCAVSGCPPFPGLTCVELAFLPRASFCLWPVFSSASPHVLRQSPETTVWPPLSVAGPTTAHYYIVMNTSADTHTPIHTLGGFVVWLKEREYKGENLPLTSKREPEFLHE